MSTRDALIARRAAKGYSPEESESLLGEILSSHSGDNLAHALFYNSFATEKQALAYTEEEQRRAALTKWQGARVGAKP